MFLPDIQTALLDLLSKVDSPDIKLIIGGGYGIYLRAELARKSEERTLFKEWPEVRSTNDLDLFLRPELLINSSQLKPLVKALNILGYSPVPGAENYQFSRAGSDSAITGLFKIDILTGPKDCFKDTPVKVDARRVRPRPSVGIHAHPTDEAVTLEKGLQPIILKGKLSSSEFYEAEIFLPHCYTFLMMKLFAFKDRFHDRNKEYGRYHALDMYAILATTKEEEWKQALELRDEHADKEFVVEAGKLINQYFTSNDQFGIIRLKENRYYRGEMQLDSFISALQELFPFKS